MDLWRTSRFLLVVLSLCLAAACGDKEPIVVDSGEDENEADVLDDAVEDEEPPAPDVDEPDLPPENNNAPDLPDMDMPEDLGDDVDHDPFEPQLPVPIRAETEGFASSRVCADCHSSSPRAQAMRGSNGENIAPFDLWRSSMMAMASRDPFWRAQVSAEIYNTPSQAEEISSVCVRCHAPMAAVELERQGILATEDTLFTQDEALAELVYDGISCTFCHQQDNANFGDPSSYTGGFMVRNDREILGPFDDPYAGPMEDSVGFTPAKGDHIAEGAACGPCHTLLTPTLSPEGEELGYIFPEQTTYLEWGNSSYNAGPNAGPKARPCIDCHMLSTDQNGGTINTKIARKPDGTDFENIPNRDEVRRHAWMGSNYSVPAIIRDARELLAPDVPREAFDATIAATKKHLRDNSAELEVFSAVSSGDTCVVRMRVSHDAGHKFPTGFPSRRSWIRLRVYDENDQVIFSSGEFDGVGRLLGGDGQPLPSEYAGGPILPHFQTIDNRNQVQVYESFMGTADGTPTGILMRAAFFIKDNRLLPEGYSASHPSHERTRPIGVGDDLDFLNREDMVEYRIALNGQTAERVEASLYFQDLGVRFMNELFLVETPEVLFFKGLYEASDRQPFEIHNVTQSVFTP